jgi:putative ABC transport system substrate-binding protein
VKRRDFITLIGGAAVALPLEARAQQAATPAIGFLDARLPDTMGDRLRGFRQGLHENGYVEGDNVTVLYRWGENKLDRLPELAAELVGRRVSVIIGSGGLPAILAAKAATATIPVVFIVSEDPVRLGLVKSLARPEGNLTGVNFYNSELVAKQLELLRELVPQAVAVAALVNPANLNTSEATLRDIEPAARAMGLQIKLLRASTSPEIDAAFAALALERADALFVGNDAFFNSRRVQLVQLAAHHRLPAVYSGREYSDIGGLISYGTNIGDAYRQVGLYAGRVVKGAKPTDLPVLQSSTFELVINHQTARTLGLTVPDKLLARADEVIE